MILFLTSSPTGPLDNSRKVDGIDRKNYLVENFQKYWKSQMRCLYITAMPADYTLNDEIRHGMRHTWEKEGFSIGDFDIWDDRTTDYSKEMLHSYDLIILGGGHVPTQNAFFKRISLREKIKDFEGMVIGISAGTMNSADVVYAQPEEAGEGVDPSYQKFIEGLGLTKFNVCPHYQMVKDFYLDGLRLFEDITYQDSYGHEFIALPDGSYILGADGVEMIWGEAYVIKDGSIQKICEDGQTFHIY